jgi:hypothetical protein
MGVSESCPWFTHSAIANYFGSLGILYTDAMKSGATDITYRSIFDETFLKRTFLRSDEDEYIRAPLDKKSIAKMLCVWTTSKSITEDQQIAAVLTSAHSLAYSWGIEYFTEVENCISDIISSRPDLQPFIGTVGSGAARILPTFQGYTDRMYGDTRM